MAHIPTLAWATNGLRTSTFLLLAGASLSGCNEQSEASEKRQAVEPDLYAEQGNRGKPDQGELAPHLVGLIGVIGPTSGEGNYEHGQRQKRAIEFAMKRLDIFLEHRTLDWFHPDMVVFKDDQGAPDKAEEIARDLANGNAAVIIGAANSRCTRRVRDVGAGAELPVITAISTATALTDEQSTPPWFFRVAISDRVQMSQVANGLRDLDGARGGKRGVLVFYQKDDLYGEGLKNDFDAAWDEGDVIAVGFERDKDELDDEDVSRLFSEARKRLEERRNEDGEGELWSEVNSIGLCGLYSDALSIATYINKRVLSIKNDLGLAHDDWLYLFGGSGIETEPFTASKGAAYALVLTHRENQAITKWASRFEKEAEQKGTKAEDDEIDFDHYVAKSIDAFCLVLLAIDEVIGDADIAQHPSFERENRGALRREIREELTAWHNASNGADGTDRYDPLSGMEGFDQNGDAWNDDEAERQVLLQFVAADGGLRSLRDLPETDPRGHARIFKMGAGGFLLLGTLYLGILLLRGLQERLRPSPYVVGRPADRRTFVGRADLVAKLASGIVNESFALLGEPGIGKTSIQWQVFDKLQGGAYQNKEFFCVFVDLQRLESRRRLYREHFFRFLIRSVRDAIEEWVPGPQLDRLHERRIDEDDFYDYRRLERELGELIQLLEREACRQSVILVLHIDNVSILDGIEAEALEGLGLLLRNAKIRAILSGTSLPNERIGAIRAWTGPLSINRVESFTPYEARELIRLPARHRLRFDEDAVDRIVHVCRCRPSEIQRLCDRIFELTRSRKLWKRARVRQKEVEQAEQRLGIKQYVDGPPAIGVHFYGFESELRQALEAAGALWVVGRRKSGKTSFLRKLEREHLSGGALAVYGNLGVLRVNATNSELLDAILSRGLSEEEEENWRADWQEKQATTEPEIFLAELFRSLRDNRNVVLLLDGADRLLQSRRANELVERLLQLLESDDWFSLVIASSLQLRRSNTLSGRPRFWNDFTTIFLTGLLEADARRLVLCAQTSGPEPRVDEAELAELVSWCGGQPFLLQIAAKARAARVEGSGTSLEPAALTDHDMRPAELLKEDLQGLTSKERAVLDRLTGGTSSAEKLPCEIRHSTDEAQAELRSLRSFGFLEPDRFALRGRWLRNALEEVGSAELPQEETPTSPFDSAEPQEDTRPHTSRPSPTSRSPKIKLLFLAADPVESQPVDQSKELAEIKRSIGTTDGREHLHVEPFLQLRPHEFFTSLNAIPEEDPVIVHFSGHGSIDGGIYVLNNKDEKVLFSLAQLKEAFDSVENNIRVVFLNACYSEKAAEWLTGVSDCVVGIQEGIYDESAINFACGFYRTIGQGKSVEKAFQQAKVLIDPSRSPDNMFEITIEDEPVLRCREGVNPNEVILVRLAEGSG